MQTFSFQFFRLLTTSNMLCVTETPGTSVHHGGRHGRVRGRGHRGAREWLCVSRSQQEHTFSSSHRLVDFKFLNPHRLHSTPEHSFQEAEGDLLSAATFPTSFIKSRSAKGFFQSAERSISFRRCPPLAPLRFPRLPPPGSPPTSRSRTTNNDGHSKIATTVRQWVRLLGAATVPWRFPPLSCRLPSPPSAPTSSPGARGPGGRIQIQQTEKRLLARAHLIRRMNMTCLPPHFLHSMPSRLKQPISQQEVASRCQWRGRETHRRDRSTSSPIRWKLSGPSMEAPPLPTLGFKMIRCRCFPWGIRGGAACRAWEIVGMPPLLRPDVTVSRAFRPKRPLLIGWKISATRCKTSVIMSTVGHFRRPTGLTVAKTMSKMKTTTTSSCQMSWKNL